MRRRTDDIHIKEIKELTPPIYLIETNPITDTASHTVYNARQAISRLLCDQDDRLLVVIGPCSIHDTEAALEYAGKLKGLRDELAEDLEVVMRVYFEKPRTTVGWKGLINDPYLDDSFEINDGLRTARKLLLSINDLGVPAGTEFLDMISPQYFADLISWGAIGARTTESQVHRELSSGLSCPVGFKNGTDGNLKIAVDAIRAAQVPHHFLSVTKLGHSAIVSTTGNPDCHVILRGGKEPNYDAASVDAAAKELEKVGLSPKLMVDFSHANSRKDYRRQMEVTDDVANQLAAGEKRIFGVMIESHLQEGRQDLIPGKELCYGQSITDACIGWADTEVALRRLASAVRERRANACAQ
ncbi:3-deoxy-7-phosphoheptulonate synthase [Chitinivorax tropicus]|uniref:Phospho-2-dehydro-3-deoxyheptonate aldolase n=1 Tax=Chitinivorax tropicus TaxID=714531 RepID=A0A840MJ67_9PROT|nr:3-deoxy-7-phosphoheptulonate synthase AroG [Chitinivorax tropicus]MBB5019244.1 3-deoxy-7-phosphoheptulonate synthase [Chitinivorax tropicus]